MLEVEHDRALAAEERGGEAGVRGRRESQPSQSLGGMGNRRFWAGAVLGGARCGGARLEHAEVARGHGVAGGDLRAGERRSE